MSDHQHAVDGPASRAPGLALPPPTRRGDVVDALHGVEVPDPYRWLEDLDAGETRAWITAQNQVTATHLEAIPQRARIREALAAAWDHERVGPPFRRGRRWFQLRNSGLQDQDVLWTAVADGEASVAPDGGWQVLLDPNELSDEGTTSLTGLATTDDGELVAYALSEAGSDWRTWHVRDTASGRDTGDVVPWSKFAPAEWLPDASGFLYTAYDPPEEGDEFEAANRDQQLRLHRLGTDPAHDPIVYARPDEPEWGFVAQVSHDDRWLVVTVTHGTETRTRIHLAPLTTDAAGLVTVGEIRPLLDDFDAEYDFLGALGDRLWLQTDRDAPTGRVISVAVDDPSDVREIVPQRDDRLEAARLVGGADPGDDGWLVCAWLHHATSAVTVHSLDGTEVDAIVLPEPGTAGDAGAGTGGITGGRHDDAVHLAFTSFTSPQRVLRHDLRSGDTVEAFPAGLPQRDDLVTEQVFVRSGDGADAVRIPLFLIHRGDVAPDGVRPTLLWGYGGFDIAITPHFRVPWRVWVELGGVLAVACLRGGGEYGTAWHDAGRLANKQHVFDDVVACAHWLTGDGHAERLGGDRVDDVWTAPAHLGIEGRSNGGLLVGAAITQAPERFGSAVAEVGVLDMLRFHRFTIGWAWTSDYGSPDEPEDFAVLHGYSPLHRIQAGAPYPPTLITTGDHDDRVVPGHSYKFAAALQAALAEADGQAGPALIRIDTAAGHGMGKPVSKLIDERTDVLAWHAHHLGLQPVTPVRSPARHRG